ncbi:hypothetical protein L7F22_059121 [Adiantum nelumboides]|nr:hypothetical protein [Adiantum nelumboides]
MGSARTCPPAAMVVKRPHELCAQPVGRQKRSGGTSRPVEGNEATSLPNSIFGEVRPWSRQETQRGVAMEQTGDRASKPHRERGQGESFYFCVERI